LLGLLLALAVLVRKSVNSFSFLKNRLLFSGYGYMSFILEYVVPDARPSRREARVTASL
jgi:hypothetical protein